MVKYEFMTRETRNFMEKSGTRKIVERHWTCCKSFLKNQFFTNKWKASSAIQVGIHMKNTVHIIILQGKKEQKKNCFNIKGFLKGNAIRGMNYSESNQWWKLKR